jgi:hypothetical protein
MTPYRCVNHANAAMLLVNGDAAINPPQTKFFNHVLGLRCCVYQNVNINPPTTAHRAGIPGTVVAQNNAMAYKYDTKRFTRIGGKYAADDVGDNDAVDDSRLCSFVSSFPNL